MKKIIIPALMLFILLFLPAVIAEDATPRLDLPQPENLNKALQQTLEQIKGLSLLTAFLGGALLFFAPCSIGLLPAFFAFTFKEKRRLVLATFSFFLGFAAVNSFLGLGASYLGSWLIFYLPMLVNLAALVLIAFGILAIFGKSINLIKIKNTTGKSVAEMFSLGAVFSVGYAGCAGPIMLGILTIAAVQPLLNAALLMFFYSLGLMLPLLLVSYYFDKKDIFSKLSFAKKSISIFGFKIAITNAIAGILFIFLGLVYLFFSSTGVLMQLPLEISQPIYDVVYSLQRALLSLNTPYADAIFVFAMLLFLSFLIRKYYWLNHGRKKRR